MIQLFPLSKLKPNPFNERKTFDEKALQTLADNIRLQGFHGALMGREKDGFIELAFGARRLQACFMAEVNEIPVQVKELTDQEMAFIASSENIIREDVDPKERAKHLLFLRDTFGLTSAEIHRKTGLARTSVDESIYYAFYKLDEIEPTLSLATAVKAHRLGGKAFMQTCKRMGIGGNTVDMIYAKALKEFPELKQDLIHGRILPQELNMGSLKHVNVITASQAFQRVLSRLRDTHEVIKFLTEHWDNPEVTPADRALILQRYHRMKEALPAFEEKIKAFDLQRLQ